MNRFFAFILLLATVCVVQAQENTVQGDTLVLLENKIWRAQLPDEKQYVTEMEFRDHVWRSTFLYKGKTDTLETSYGICGDTIKTYDRKQYKILELTDSTLVILYLPERMTIGVGAVKYINIVNSLAKMRENENRLDSIWRKEDIWNKGVASISGKPIKDLSTIEPPRWAKWDYDLEKYYTSQMVYPEELLKKNQVGYSVVMFSIDTLGLSRSINILTTIHKKFDKEVIRLTRELPHCLPCRDKDGKRMECFYTVYVPFLPQHYRDRLKADSIAEEELKQSFVEWETVARFQNEIPDVIQTGISAQDYIIQRLVYNSTLLGDKQRVRGVYSIQINSYGEVYTAKVLQSCGIEDWDNQVLDIIRKMPRWTPAINFRGKGEYQEFTLNIPIHFKGSRNLIAHTTENFLEVGVPVCYLNERGDTIVPYGKYRFCQTDTIRNIGFVYENRQNARIVCIDNQGKELFYAFKYDNGADYVREGLFRITDDKGLIGFADTLGNIVIKPQFKFAFPFKNGKAKVTFSGESKDVPDSNGEEHYWDSSDWFYIDKNGKMLKQ
ncbi:TonB family domain-containing protein [Bacteroides ovatus CL02T12C04]|uniref:WG repeat-containing protein n=1 Tax=Bacteroides ovatus TaxID=28116 RepID=UPI000268ED21|nr:WG repeat-containing protein [Bacteroides ovatus]EIY57646.1 TonB family domain-containing protein [Bacteroides ovatus CL02T12C04]